MNTYNEGYQKSAEITIDGIAYKIKRIDVHHFSMSDKRCPDRSIAIWHIAQLHEDAPYKDDVEKVVEDVGLTSMTISITLGGRIMKRVSKRN